MARIALADSWVANGKVDDVRAKLMEFAERNEMRFLGEAEHLQFEQGSAFYTGAIGKWFAKPRHLPKSVAVRLRKVAGGVYVEAAIQETYGERDISTDLQNKYETYFRTALEALRKAIP